MTQLQHALASQNALGEGPLWHPAAQALYWVDINGHAFQRWHPASGAVQRWALDQMPGCMAFIEGSDLILMGLQTGLGLWNPRTQALTMLDDNRAYQPVGRFNDGAADRAGRFWAGTCCEPRANHLFRMAADGSVTQMESGITVSNGLGWSPDDRTLYYSDSGEGVVYAYDFDAATGGISNRRVWFQATPGEGVADGLTVDSAGYIWSAFWDGWKVVRFAPDGTVDRVVAMPVQFPTSVMFGGPDLQTLYITSARAPVQENASQPQAGDLFALRVDVPGLPEPFARLDAALLARADL